MHVCCTAKESLPLSGDTKDSEHLYGGFLPIKSLEKHTSSISKFPLETIRELCFDWRLVHNFH